MNLVDKIVEYFSPSAGASRTAARAALESGSRSYKQTSHASSWMISKLGSETAEQVTLEALRKESRDLTSEDFLGGVISSRVEHVVGKGFAVQPQTDQVDTNSKIKEIILEAEQTIGVTRRDSLWTICREVQRSVDVDGEAFIVKSDINDGSLLPIALEVIDPARVKTPPGDMKRVINGVKYNSKGSIVGFYVQKTGDEVSFTLVPADRMYHVFSKKNPNQNRGIPLVTPAIGKARDARDLSDASLVAAQVEACFAGFIQSKSSAASKAIGATDYTDNNNRYQNLEPGSLTYLNSDESVSFSSPTKSNTVGTLIEYTNRQIAASICWPYEFVVSDWRGTSFAGGRIVLHAAKLSVESAQKLIIEQFLTPLYKAIVHESQVMGLIAYDNTHISCKCTWVGPKWDYSLNPSEDVKARVLELDNNLTTLEAVHSASQQNWMDIASQRQIERQSERDMDIKPNANSDAETATGQEIE